VKRGLVWGVLVLAACGVGACRSGDEVARVGDMSVSREEVALRQREGATPEVALDAVVERALLAEAARRDGLLKDPVLAARVEEARREVLANAYAEAVGAKASTEEALRQRYEARKQELARREVHVAHIVVYVQPQATEQERVAAQARINAAYARVVSGEDFAKVAREVSEDTATGARGGDLGAVREGQVDSRFFDAVAELKPGAPSAPFATAFGLHVARALESPRTVTPSFEEARGVLAAQARHDAVTERMEQLRKDISVKRYPERLKAGGAPARAEGESR
jgi:peptidyl-prolyl cis-trans isomerase C